MCLMLYIYHIYVIIFLIIVVEILRLISERQFRRPVCYFGEHQTQRKKNVKISEEIPHY